MSDRGKKHEFCKTVLYTTLKVETYTILSQWNYDKLGEGGEVLVFNIVIGRSLLSRSKDSLLLSLTQS